MHHIHDREESLRKLNEMIEGIKVAMLTTAMPDGVLRSRPMATQDEACDGDLWFITESGTPKTQEIEQEHHVNLSYVDADANRYVSVSGLASIVKDQALIDQLWKPALKAWFPKGKSDPGIALLRVHVTEAEVWDSPSGVMVKMVGFIKAVATGKKYRPGENEKLHVDDGAPIQAQPGEGGRGTVEGEPLKKHGDPLGSEAGID